MSHCTEDLMEDGNYSSSLQLQPGAPCCITTADLKALYEIWDLFDLKQTSFPVSALCSF